MGFEQNKTYKIKIMFSFEFLITVKQCSNSKKKSEETFKRDESGITINLMC